MQNHRFILLAMALLFSSLVWGQATKADRYLKMALDQASLAKVEKYLKAGADPNQEYLGNLFTPIERVLYLVNVPDQQKADLIELLIKYGTRAEGRDVYTATKIIKDSPSHFRMVRAMIKRFPAIINYTRNDTPLLLAVSEGKYALAANLMALGADRSYRNYHGQTAYDVAAYKGPQGEERYLKAFQEARDRNGWRQKSLSSREAAPSAVQQRAARDKKLRERVARRTKTTRRAERRPRPKAK